MYENIKYTSKICGGYHPASYKGCDVYKNLQQNRGKSFNKITHRTIQAKINVHNINRFPLINPNQTPTQMPFASQISFSHILKQNQQTSPILGQPIFPILDQISTILTEFKTMFNQLINQNNMVLSPRNTVINKITTNE
jgi:hypothetical protein